MGNLGICLQIQGRSVEVRRAGLGLNLSSIASVSERTIWQPHYEGERRGCLMAMLSGLLTAFC